jgi:hypothetical protein
MSKIYTCEICNGNNDERHTVFKNERTICGYCNESYHDDEIEQKVAQNYLENFSIDINQKRC